MQQKNLGKEEFFQADLFNFAMRTMFDWKDYIESLAYSVEGTHFP
jgi:hypothetical protein